MNLLKVSRVKLIWRDIISRERDNLPDRDSKDFENNLLMQSVKQHTNTKSNYSKKLSLPSYSSMFHFSFKLLIEELESKKRKDSYEWIMKQNVSNVFIRVTKNIIIENWVFRQQ